MNCLESRRALATDPRRRPPDIDGHLSACGTCRNVAASLARLDADIAGAASIPVPDALAERILLARRGPPVWRYAAAAALVLATALATLIAADAVDTPFSAKTMEAVGPAHPAVAAISQVTEDGVQVPVSDADAERELEQVLKRLGLTLKKGEATAYYVGKCQMTGGTACDHIVLRTGDAQANVMLVADYPLGERVLVSDRRMSALVSPARTGGYIVVADTPRTARRMAKLFVRS